MANFSRIMVIGDSLAYGAYASLFSLSFRRLIQAAYPGSVLIGTPTYYNLPYAIYVAWPQLRHTSPDLIILEVGINDAYPFGPMDGTIAEEDWEGVYESFLRTLLTTGAVVVATTPYAFVIPSHPVYPRLVRYAEYVRRAARRVPGVILADVFFATDGCTECPSSPSIPSEIAPGFAGDNAHPGDIGHSIIAQQILGNILAAEQALSGQGDDNVVNNCTSVCCVNGLTPAPDVTDPAVCNAGKAALFQGTTGNLYVRTAISTPCVNGDWELLGDVIGPQIDIASLISSAACNGIIVAGDGLLWTRDQNLGISRHASSGQVALVSIPLTGAVAPTEWPQIAQIVITNPSACRNMNVIVVGHMSANMTDTAAGEAAFIMAFDGKFYFNAVASTPFNVGLMNHAMDAGDSYQFSSAAPVTIVILPSQVMTIQLRGIYACTGGPVTLSIAGELQLSALAVLD